jgi:hypothetical protein
MSATGPLCAVRSSGLSPATEVAIALEELAAGEARRSSATAEPRDDHFKKRRLQLRYLTDTV